MDQYEGKKDVMAYFTRLSSKDMTNPESVLHGVTGLAQMMSINAQQDAKVVLGMQRLKEGEVASPQLVATARYIGLAYLAAITRCYPEAPEPKKPHQERQRCTRTSLHCIGAPLGWRSGSLRHGPRRCVAHNVGRDQGLGGTQAQSHP
jgi:hypothetical protein